MAPYRDCNTSASDFTLIQEVHMINICIKLIGLYSLCDDLGQGKRVLSCFKFSSHCMLFIGTFLVCIYSGEFFMKASTWCQQPSSWHFLLCCADTPYPKFNPSIRNSLGECLYMLLRQDLCAPALCLPASKFNASHRLTFTT